MKNKSVYIIGILFTIVFVIILLMMPSSLVSSTNSSYKTSISGSDYARVAKWNIVSVDKDGNNVLMDVDFVKKLDSGSTGYWFFEMNNQSEVLAELDNSSSITLKLKHNNFSGLANEITWNFLEGDNPVTFRGLFFDDSIDNILRYENIQTSQVITINQYNKLQDDEKVNYKEVIIKTETKILFKTNSTLKFQRKIDNGEAYYESVIPLTFPSENKVMDMTGNKKTIALYWNVSDSSTGSGTSITNKYNAYSLVTDATNKQIVTGTNATGYPIGDSRYYIVYDEKDYFDYLNTFGFEPMFVFPTTLIGGTEKVSYSKLTSAQIQTITSYEINNTSSLDDLKHYVEKLTYVQFSAFEKDVEKFEQEQGYIGYGLICNILFNIRVSQVD
ncbi:unknown [Coprobacillus sp. CAG:698]|nr:unknown [Coprobacillus sp. CAG:698]